MAYIPPLKRHTDEEGSAPIPDSMIPRFKGNLNLGVRPTSRRKDRDLLLRRQIIYVKHSISRWWPVGSKDDDDMIPATFSLEPFSHDQINIQTGEKPLVLVGRRLSSEEIETMEKIREEPWISITEKIFPYLLATLEEEWNEMQSSTEAFKPTLVARFGTIFFHG